MGDSNQWLKLAQLRTGTYVATNGAPVPANDVSCTHTIGHVAYWGDAFVGILGPTNAPLIDPIQIERDLDIPFSFDSDSTVTVPVPLYYIEQGMIRTTWPYPALSNSNKYVLGSNQVATLDEALRAVTIIPARQHELDQWVGSIETGKVADFVILDKDITTIAPDQIHTINVVDTYLGGKLTWNPWARGSEHLGLLLFP